MSDLDELVRRLRAVWPRDPEEGEISSYDREAMLDAADALEQQSAEIERLKLQISEDLEHSDGTNKALVEVGQLNSKLLAALEAVMAEHREGYGLRCEAEVRAAIAEAENL